jgi:hypothetical protein
MKFIPSIPYLILSFTTVISTRAEMASWTSKAGTTVEAELLDANLTTLTLRLKDGRTIRVLKTDLDEKSQKNIPETGTAVREIITDEDEKNDNDSIPLELKHYIYKNKRHYWTPKNSAGQPDLKNQIIGAYKSEDATGVTITSKGKPITLTWDNIATTGPRKGQLDGREPFRGLVGEEIIWPAMDIKNWPNAVPGDVKIWMNTDKYPYELKDGKLKFEYQTDPSKKALINIHVTPPKVTPGEYIRFGIKYTDYYRGRLYGKTTEETFLPVAVIFLWLKNGENLKIRLSGFVGPNGENTTADNYYPWTKINAEIERCMISIPTDLHPLKPKMENSLEVVFLKAYKAFYQKD